MHLLKSLHEPNLYVYNDMADMHELFDFAPKTDLPSGNFQSMYKLQSEGKMCKTGILRFPFFSELTVLFKVTL